MTWQQLSVTAQVNTVAQIADLFTELGAVSVTYLDAADQAVYEPQPGETKIWQHTKVVGLFEMDVDLDIIQSVIVKQFSDIAVHDWQQETLADQVWERAWMAHFRPMKFGTRLWVCPTGQAPDETDSVCLTLDPGLAFGTGTHPTTALCLEWLSEHNVANKTIIDYGCGSGILAIAALLLGAKQAYAVDIDPQAITATRDNAKKNQVTERIHCYLPEDFPQQPADIVVANILAKPLIELSTNIIKLIKPGGILVLSGILNEQADTVVACYAQQLNVLTPASLQDWCRIVACKADVA